LTLGGATGIDIAGNLSAVGLTIEDDVTATDSGPQEFDAEGGTLTAQSITKASGDLTLGGATGIDIAGNLSAVGLTIEDDVTATDSGPQEFDAEGGTLTAQSITKASGDLTLGGATGIDLDGTVDVQGGNFNLEDNVIVADDEMLKAGVNVTVAAGKTLTGEGDLKLEATNGAVTEEVGDDNKVQIIMAVDDKTLTLTQNDSINMADFSVTNDEDTALDGHSTGGSVTSTTADSWKSVAADADGDITLQGSDAIRDIFTERLHSDNGDISVRSENRNIVANAEIKADAGGVELIAENGSIYTTGAMVEDKDDLLVNAINVSITGFSDGTEGAVIPNPLGPDEGKAAIVIITEDDLAIGEDCKLTANGIYDPTNDERNDAIFEEDGSEIDVAVYLRSISGDMILGSSTPLPVGPVIDIASAGGVGTLVVDAYDTVTFNESFENYLKSPSSTMKRIEVVSRITSSLTTEIEQDRFPHGDNPDAVLGLWTNFGDYPYSGYGLRGEDGGVVDKAWVLSMTDPVPLVPPKPMEPEVRGEVEGPDTEALRRLLEQLGLGEQPELARAYPPSLNTDMDLYKAAERLNELVPVLQNTNLIAAMDAIIVEVWHDVDSPLAPEQRAVIAQRIGDSPARGWLVAITDFADILTAMVGRSERESVDTVMATYVIPQMQAGVFHEQTVAFVETQLIPVGG